MNNEATGNIIVSFHENLLPPSWQKLESERINLELVEIVREHLIWVNETSPWLEEATSKFLDMLGQGFFRPFVGSSFEILSRRGFPDNEAYISKLVKGLEELSLQFRGIVSNFVWDCIAANGMDPVIKEDVLALLFGETDLPLQPMAKSVLKAVSKATRFGLNAQSVILKHTGSMYTYESGWLDSVVLTAGQFTITFDNPRAKKSKSPPLPNVEAEGSFSVIPVQVGQESQELAQLLLQCLCEESYLAIQKHHGPLYWENPDYSVEKALGVSLLCS